MSRPRRPMYRDDLPTQLAKIERLERELSDAYTTFDAPRTRTKTRSRSARLAKIERRVEELTDRLRSRRARQKRAKRAWRKLPVLAASLPIRWPLAFTLVVLGIGALLGHFASGVIAHHRAMVMSSTATRSTPVGEAPVNAVAASKIDETAAHESPPRVEPPIEAKVVPEETAIKSAAASDENPPPRISVAARQKMLALATDLFAALHDKNGARLAKIAHPLGGLNLVDEAVVVWPEVLSKCFTDGTQFNWTEPVSDETKSSTCGELMSWYREPDFRNAPDSTFDTASMPGYRFVPDTVADQISLFVVYPGAENQELSWKGVELRFEALGDGYVIRALRRAYWTP